MATTKLKKQLEVTPIEDIKAYAAGEIIDLPPFSNGKPFRVQAKRPSMLVLMKSGKIPNKLMKTANEIFSGSGVDTKTNDDYFKNIFEVIEILAEASLVSPTYKELKDAGIVLTDEQYIYLFNFTQKGVDALDSFRGESEDTADRENG